MFFGTVDDGAIKHVACCEADLPTDVSVNVNRMFLFFLPGFVGLHNQTSELFRSYRCESGDNS